MEHLGQDFLIMVSDLHCLTQCFHPRTPAQKWLFEHETLRAIQQLYLSQFQLDRATYLGVLDSFICQIHSFITTMNGQAESYCLRFSFATLPKENKAVFSPRDVRFLKIMEIFLGLHFSVFRREDNCEYPNDH